MEERRKSPRIDLNLPAHWESATGVQEEGSLIVARADVLWQVKLRSPAMNR